VFTTGRKYSLFVVVTLINVTGRTTSTFWVINIEKYTVMSPNPWAYPCLLVIYKPGNIEFSHFVLVFSQSKR